VKPRLSVIGLPVDFARRISIEWWIVVMATRSRGSSSASEVHLVRGVDVAVGEGWEIEQEGDSWRKGEEYGDWVQIEVTPRLRISFAGDSTPTTA
jgi:hypothetical protein